MSCTIDIKLYCQRVNVTNAKLAVLTDAKVSSTPDDGMNEY